MFLLLMVLVDLLGVLCCIIGVFIAVSRDIRGDPRSRTKKSSAFDSRTVETL